jgi:hypothetical protein
MVVAEFVTTLHTVPSFNSIYSAGNTASRCQCHHIVIGNSAVLACNGRGHHTGGATGTDT